MTRGSKQKLHQSYSEAGSPSLQAALIQKKKIPSYSLKYKLINVFAIAIAN